MSSIKQVLPAENTKGVRAFCSYSFSRALSARYSVLHFWVYCRAVIEPPLCKGRWLVWRDGGIVKAKFYSKTIPQSPSVTAPFAQGSLWSVRSESLSAFPDKHCFCRHKGNFYFDFSFISAIPSLNPSRKPYQPSFTL